MEQCGLIVALDIAEHHLALALVDKLDPNQCALKVGSEAFTRFGPDFVTAIVQRGFKVFLDLKFHDIPNTVAQACKSAADLGVWMMNVHASGGLEMMRAARNALSDLADHERPLLIAVTVLTSMTPSQLATLGISNSLESQVTLLAKMAQNAELDGVVCSPLEVPAIKSACSASFLCVTPGVRFANASQDDQHRITTPVEAMDLGSDYLVIGRPITQSADPSQVVTSILNALARP